MRLSTAIMLGAATCKMVPGDINSCALGAALNAVGAPLLGCQIGGFSRLNRLELEWPWLFSARYGRPFWHGGINEITYRFDYEVCSGAMTLEQLVDYVRSIEPDCDCNRFNCDCKQVAESVPSEAVHA